jgi:precorrin-4 C11-methyltransferase
MKKIYFVSAGPGDPELLTIKARRLLDEADVVIYTGSLINLKILKGLKAELYDSSGMSLDEITKVIVSSLKEDKKVVRLHSGDTSFYSSVSEQISRLTKMGIYYEIVPGVSSASATSAKLGQELTIPEVSQTIIFSRLEGRTPVPKSERLKALATHRATMVIFLSIGMIDRVVKELTEGGYPPDTPVVVAYKVSWPQEMLIRGTLENIAEKVKAENIQRTALILVGEALRASEGKATPESRLYNRNFSHSYRNLGQQKGKLFIVGIGPGGKEHMSPLAYRSIEQADLIVGYTTYVELIRDLAASKEVVTTPMTQEIQRCDIALKAAESGRRVALVSGGDPGIYALAGLVFEMISTKAEPPNIEIEVIPGIPALSACASKLGAPLMHDFVTVSLSDRLTPWRMIEQRLRAASQADFVIVLYNPQSRGREGYLRRAIKIISEYRSPDTPVGVVKAATRKNEKIWVCTLSTLNTEEIDMQSTVIVGNSTTFLWNEWMVTPRGYSKKYSLNLNNS